MAVVVPVMRDVDVEEGLCHPQHGGPARPHTQVTLLGTSCWVSHTIRRVLRGHELLVCFLPGAEVRTARPTRVRSPSICIQPRGADVDYGHDVQFGVGYAPNAQRFPGSDQASRTARTTKTEVSTTAPTRSPVSARCCRGLQSCHLRSRGLGLARRQARRQSSGRQASHGVAFSPLRSVVY